MDEKKSKKISRKKSTNSNKKISGAAKLKKGAKPEDNDVIALRERFYLTFKFSPVPMGITTLGEGRFVDVNKSFTQHSGYSREELIGYNSIGLGMFSAKDRENVKTELFKKKKLKNFSIMVKNKKGESFELLWSAIIIKFANQDCLLSTFIDITEINLVGKRLKQYTRRLGMLLDLNRAILEVRSPRKIAIDALTRIKKLVPCQRLTVDLLDFESNTVENIAIKVEKKYRVKKSRRIPLQQFEKYIKAMERGEVIITQDSSTRINEFEFAKDFVKLGFKSSISVPLIFHDNLIGSLNLYARDKNFFTREYIDSARDIAGPLAIAIHQARLYEDLRNGRERLESLSLQLVRAQETERRYISQEILHDGIGQELTVLKFNLSNMKRLSVNPIMKDMVEESLNILDNVNKEVHDLSIELRPPMIDDFGLAPTLEWLLDRHSERTGIPTYFFPGPINTPLSKELETTCFRVVQEALTNIARHSKAKNIDIELQQIKDELILKIRDDGIGFNFKKAMKQSILGTNLGLLGMQERVKLIGGELKIETSPKYGTCILVKFPLKD